jgi:hypothetical protein
MERIYQVLGPFRLPDRIRGEELVPNDALNLTRGAIVEIVISQVTPRQGRIVAGDGLEASILMFEERVRVRLAVKQVDVSVENSQHQEPLFSRLRIST